MENKDYKAKPVLQKEQKPLRILPGIIIVILQWITWLIIPNFGYGMVATATMVFGGLVGGLVFIIWWALYSRIPYIQRWIALVLMILTLVLLQGFTHESIKTGMDGLMYFVYAVPTLCFSLIIWVVVRKYFKKRFQLITLIFAILIACSGWLLVRSNGLSGRAKADFAWRWDNPESEQIFTINPKINTVHELANIEAEWPGFRGPNRDGIVEGVKIKTDWSTSPPIELWRRPIGPGCSSFAVRGNLIYTQEQNGEYEIISCYNILNGESVWRHQDSARFYDQHAGAGPRSTPTINENNIYTLGATGILNALNASNGKVLWSRNAASDTNIKDSGWGFTCSPLVVENNVIVAVAGKLIAYNKNTGEQVWIGSDGGDSYSSPHLMNIDGVSQIVFMSGNGIISVSQEDGKLNWVHSWPAETRIIQPALTANGELIINSGMKKGMRKINITKENEDWNIQEIWTSSRMRPDFNDFVIHKGHIYGFEGPYIACMNIADGERMWKGNLYGGQLILLADQDILIVLSEKGELVLVKADPNNFTELASIKAIEGKTWNHPVLAGNILLVRNTKEMVAFQL